MGGQRTPYLPPRWFVRNAWAVHRALDWITAGRFGVRRATSNHWGILRLRTVGRRTGTARVAILAYFEEGSDLATMAINGWGDPEPAWWRNLQAQRDATVELPDGPRSVVCARGCRRGRTTPPLGTLGPLQQESGQVRRAAIARDSDRDPRAGAPNGINALLRRLAIQREPDSELGHLAMSIEPGGGPQSGFSRSGPFRSTACGQSGAVMSDACTLARLDDLDDVGDELPQSSARRLSRCSCRGTAGGRPPRGRPSSSQSSA